MSREGVSAEDSPFETRGKADCILLHGVLEHLFEPAAFLKLCRQHLKPDGVLLAWIPNAQHWQTLQRALVGRLDGAGANDRPIGFSLPTLRQMFKEAKFELQNVIPHSPAPELAGDFLKALEPALVQLRTSPDTFQKLATTSDFLIKATKRSPQARQIQTLTLRSVGGLNEVRVYQPSLFLKLEPGVTTEVAQQSVRKLPLTPGEAKFVIRQRLRFTEEMRGTCRELLDLGYISITEFDDDPRGFSQIVDSNFAVFRAVHAVQTSTDELAKLFRQWNPNVAVFPNQIADLPPLQLRESDRRIRLFFGALNRKHSWEPLIPHINRALQKLGEKVEVNVLVAKDFFDALDVKHKRLSALQDYPQYLKSMQNADIALLPLVDAEFNRMKSDLKFIEAASRSTAVIASPTVYEKTIVHGKTGLICPEIADFEQAIVELVEKPKLRNRLIRNAYNYVRSKRMLSAHYMKRLEWYDSLAARQEELTRELIARAPEIYG